MVLFKVVRQEHTMSTALKHVIIVRITKLVTLILGSVNDNGCALPGFKSPLCSGKLFKPGNLYGVQ